MAAKDEYDLVVIGSGPGGYVAAIRAAQLGFSTAIVEKWSTLGGTCLNIGCIPSKALLDTSELFHRANHEFLDAGIEISTPKLDLGKVHARKTAVVNKLTSGVAFLMKQNKIDVFTGTGSIVSPRQVSVRSAGGTKSLRTRRVLIATGSVPTELPGLKFDGHTVVDSETALAFERVPKKLVIVGAGAIGLELGSVWMRFGAEVTVVELMSGALPGWDTQVAKLLQRELARQGMKFIFDSKVTSVSLGGNSAGSAETAAAGSGGKPARGAGKVARGARDAADSDSAGSAKSDNGTKSMAIVTVESSGGKTQELSADKVLVAVGRRPFTAGLGLDALGVAMEGRSGRIQVDDHFRTSVEGIYAIGDVVHGPMLAHKAEDEGIAAVERMAGVAGSVEYETIPGVVYTWPEVATVGKSEETLKAEGIAYRKGTFQFSANGRALAMGAGVGIVKILADETTDRILGVHIVGPFASDLISEAVLAMVYRASAEDLARTVHAHPTLPEVVREAALAVDGRSIHST